MNVVSKIMASLGLKHILLGGITLIYILVFTPAYQGQGVSFVGLLSLLPIVYAGYVFGRRAGVLVTLLITLVGITLAGRAGYPVLERVGDVVVGALSLVLSGLAAGWLREQVNAREGLRSQLEASEERLHSVVTNAPVILFALDRQGVFTLSEGKALDILGVKPGEVVGKSIFHLYQNVPSLLVAFRRALAGDNVIETIRGPGLAFETRMSPIRDKSGQVSGVIAIASDVYSRLLAEEAYRSLVENSLQGLVILQEGQIVFANTAEADITGYTVDELTAMSLEQILGIVHLEDRQRVARRLQARLEDPSIPPRNEFRLVRKDGEARWVETYATSIHYRGKPALQFVTLDVTERKQIEVTRREAEALRLELEKERELKELKGRFVSLVSHQFRTPLTVINTTTFLIERHYDRLDDEKRAEYFNKIRGQVTHVNDLIDTILMMSENEARRIAFSPQPLDLVAFSGDILAEMQLTAGANHRLMFHRNGAMPAVMADAKLLRHVLTNLLSNAIKYSPEGGEIALTVAQDSDDVVFVIQDQGIGIPADDLKHLFEPFHRGRNTLGIKGTGLGLKIARDFVELHGGAIDCDSEEGKGTTFMVRLPLFH